jgi:hypothetical protein
MSCTADGKPPLHPSFRLVGRENRGSSRNSGEISWTNPNIANTQTSHEIGRHPDLDTHHSIHHSSDLYTCPTLTSTRILKGDYTHPHPRWKPRANPPRISSSLRGSRRPPFSPCSEFNVPSLDHLDLLSGPLWWSLDRRSSRVSSRLVVVVGLQVWRAQRDDARKRE